MLKNNQMKKVVKIVAVICLLLVGLLVKSADRPMHEIHSVLMFNFIKHVEWPQTAKTGNFVVGVYGDEEVYKTLSTYYANRTIKGQQVKIVKVNELGAIHKAHVIYLSKGHSKSFESLKNKFNGKPTLIITDGYNLGKKGSCINFKEIGGKLKFEINQSSLKQNKLKLSSQLASMGIMI